jgi:3',5'-nucleoside bisphosphate phosphatase
MNNIIHHHPRDRHIGEHAAIGETVAEGRYGDLHMHTAYSDGALSPEEVVRKAAGKGLAAVAITDHDTVGGLEEALAAGSACGIDVIPGIELSAMWGDREIHILGYFLDFRDTSLLKYLAFFRSKRIERARKIVERLNELDIPVEIDSILYATRNAAVGRPHIAAAVIETGRVKSYLEVFNKYIGYGCPAYVEKYRLEVGEAAELIARAGGLSFLAHPTDAIQKTVLYDVIKSGLDGIETVHPSLTKQKSEMYRAIAADHHLLQSGGSDFHGGKRNDETNIGRYGIPLAYIDAMKKKLVA